MTNDEILTQMNDIFRRVLDDPGVALRPETTARDVPGWDSLSHVQLVVAVEKHFKIKFSSREIFSFKNVGDMCTAIGQKKLA
jgi:acyl carrier protein